jgi:hypothetical protein
MSDFIFNILSNIGGTEIQTIYNIVSFVVDLVLTILGIIILLTALASSQ